MQHLDYIKWFALFAWLPTAIIWAFNWRVLRPYARVFLLCIVCANIAAFPWDFWATHSWLWHFSPEHTLNVKFLGLPVEEYIFFTSETFLYASIALVLRNYFKKRKLV